MVRIGIIGDGEDFHTMKTISRLYQSKGIKVFSKQVTNAAPATPFKWITQAGRKKAEILLIAMEQNQLSAKIWNGVRFHILVYLKGKKENREKSKKLSDFLAEKNVVILNSDDRDLFPFSISTGTTLITCGINSKASVTASSVICDGVHETIQCCIQRAIHTISGEKLDPQEFSVRIKNENQNITGLLAAVATVMADDIEISESLSIF